MFENFIIIADASGESSKIAQIKNEKIVSEIEDGGAALENFANLISQMNPREAEAFLLSEGPGSILGTRAASLHVSVAALFSGAKIYSFDIMRVSALAIANKVREAFSLLAPSRKGFVNILDFDGKNIIDEREIEIAQLPDFARERIFLLNQRKKVAATIENYTRANPTLSEIWLAIQAHPEELTLRNEAIEAKSLTKREYAKWKAQAHI